MPFNSKYIVLNYSSKLGPDDKQSYEFWYCHETIKIISYDGRPFSRGDVAEVLEINQDTSTDIGPYILINVIGDPMVDRMPEELRNSSEVPTLIFVRTTIFLDENADYAFEEIDNTEILMAFSSINDSNKVYVVVALVQGSLAKIRAHDKTNGNEFEWVVCDADPNYQKCS